MKGYAAISANNEATNIFYIACFTSVPYTHQENVESDGNILACGGLVCKAIYTSIGWHKIGFLSSYLKKLWLCQWTQLILQILTIMFGPVKVSCHKGLSYITSHNPKLQNKYPRTYRHWLWSNKGINCKDWTCLVQHCCWIFLWILVI